MINICFHGIGRCAHEREPGEARYWMAEKTFLDVLDVVADSPGVRLSFDDGNRSDTDIALPALQERGLTATFFVLAGRLEDPASLSPGDLRSLRDAGMSIGSHGWQHIPWRGLDAAAAQREFVTARAALEEAAGTRITEAALPLGRYDRETLRRLKEAGYDAVYTSDRFPARSGAWLRARYSVTSSDTADTVRSIARGRIGVREVRNYAASAVKRMRRS